MTSISTLHAGGLNKEEEKKLRKEITRLKNKHEKNRKAYEISLKATRKEALDFAVDKYKSS